MNPSKKRLVWLGIVLIASAGFGVSKFHPVAHCEPTLALEPQIDSCSPRDDASNRESKTNEHSDGRPHVGVRSYPVFMLDEVLSHISNTGSRLYREGKTKSESELRKNLKIQSCELTLPKASEKTISGCDLYRRVCESIFIVCSLSKPENGEDWQSSFATAFAVTEDGVLSSCCHVFVHDDDADAVVVMDMNKNVYTVTELLATNKDTDTCLFRIDARRLKPLPLAVVNAQPGSEVRIIGHPGESFFYFSAGHVTNYERDRERVLWMNVTADFGQGSSGGPVFDALGNVIGQVSRTFTLYADGAPTQGNRQTTSFVRASTDNSHQDEDSKNEGLSAKKNMDTQMIFRSCVPIESVRLLIKNKE